MGAPNPEMVPVDNSSAEALLNTLDGMAAAERRKHASIFNYWLTIRGDRQFPPIRDLDPLEISDASPWSMLLELIGSGEDAVVRHFGQEIKDGDVEMIARAPAASLLAAVHAKLPTVASSRQALAFEDTFETADGPRRFWATLLPFSATGTWIDYVYGFVSLESGNAEAEEQPAEVEAAVPEQVQEAADEPAEPFQVPLRPFYDEGEPAEDVPQVADLVVESTEDLPEVAEIADEPVVDIPAAAEAVDEVADLVEAAEPVETAFEEGQPTAETDPVPAPEPEPEPEAQVEPQPVDEIPVEDPEPVAATRPTKPGFSAKLFESLASVGGFYGRVVEVQPVETELTVSEPEPEPVEESEFVQEEPIEEPVAEEMSAPEQPAEEQAEQPRPTMEGALQDKLSEVRAKADEARQAKLRSIKALEEGLSAAYDFALDAEHEPEEYLRLVEAQGLKIQLRSPMKPVAKLAFAESCDEDTIAQLEVILAWALKADLPRGTLGERIEAEGGIEQFLEGLDRAA